MGLFGKKIIRQKSCGQCNEKDGELLDLKIDSKDQYFHHKCLVDFLFQQKTLSNKIMCRKCGKPLTTTLNSDNQPALICTNCESLVEGNYFSLDNLKGRGFTTMLEYLSGSSQIMLLKHSDFPSKPKKNIYSDSDFTHLIKNNNSELNKTIEIAYNQPVEIKSKLFFSKNNSSIIYSKEFSEFTYKNIVHLNMEVSKKTNSSQWNYGGQFNIGDDFDSGYTLIISIRDGNSELNSFMIKKLNVIGFGCMPSNNTIHCHYNSDSPNDDEAKQLLQQVIHAIFN